MIPCSPCPACLPAHSGSSTDPGPGPRRDAGTGSGGGGNSPRLKNQQLRELSLYGPPDLGPTCALVLGGVLCALRPPHAPRGAGRRQALTLLQCLHSSNSKGSTNASCPQNGLFWGNFPAVLRSGEGGGAAPWAPALIWRWEADSPASLPAARVPCLAIYGAEIQCVPTCMVASRPRDVARGFARREEVQAGLAGG